MEFYFFKPVPASYASAFRMHYNKQNLKITRISSGIIGTISSSMLLLNLIYSFGATNSNNAFYTKITIFQSIICAVIFAVSFLPVSKIRSINPQYFNQALTFIFCYWYALSCLLVSLEKHQNPKNTLSIYLLGLTAVAVLWILENWQHLLFIFLIELSFMLSMQRLELSTNQLIQGYIVSVFLISFFYVAARMFYSFRANNYIQLQEIARKNAEIQQISQAKSDILSVVAHDLLSPFAGIEALINLLRKQNLSAEKQEQYFKIVLSQCRTSRNLIHDLLESGRFENEPVVDTEKIELNAFIEEICTKWQTQVKDLREISFNKARTPVYVNINKERFNRVIDNLMTNAVKFTFENGQITIDLSPKDKELLLYISDDGIGIPKHLQPYLFQRFSKARRKGLKGEDSTGLGLSITQQLVQEIGGSITVESAENAGTTFSISLPAV